MEGIGEKLDASRFKKRPRYTMMFHEVREKLDISSNTYIVVDSVHKLSTTDHKYPFCIMSKPDLARFLGLGERTVFRCLKEALEKGLIEKHELGLRSTEKWVRSVEIYDIKTGR